MPTNKGTSNVVNGVASLVVNETLSPGTYTITGAYNQNDHYKGSSGTAELEILKLSPKTRISTNKTEYLVGEDIILRVAVVYGMNSVTEGVFSIYVDNVLLQSNVVIQGSTTSIQLNELSTVASTKSIQVIYQGTSTYNTSTSNTTTIQVNKYETVIDSIQVKLHSDMGSASSIRAKVLDSNNNPVTIGTVHAKLGGQNITDDEDNVIMVTPDEEGMIEIIPYLYGLTSGSSYQVQLNYSGTEYYSSATETVVVTAIETPVITGFTEEDGICGYYNYSKDVSLLTLNITTTIPQDAVYEGVDCIPILEKMPLIIEYTDTIGNTIFFSIEGAVSNGFNGTVGNIARTLFYTDGEYTMVMEENALDLIMYIPEELISNPPASIHVYLDDDSFTPSFVEILPYLTDPTLGYFDIANWGTYPNGTSGSNQTGTLTPATSSDLTINESTQLITANNTKYFVYNATLKDFLDYFEGEFSFITYKTGGDGRFDIGFVNTTTGGYKLGYLCNSGSQVISNEENNIRITTHEVGDGQVKYQKYNQFTFKQIGTDIHMYYCIQASRYVDRTIPLGNIDPSKYYFYIKGYNQRGLSITTDESKINYYSRQ